MANPDSEIKTLMLESKSMLEAIRGDVDRLEQDQKAGKPVGEVKAKIEAMEAKQTEVVDLVEKMEVERKKEKMLQAATDAVQRKAARPLTPEAAAYKRAFFANLRSDISSDDAKALREGIEAMKSGMGPKEAKALVENSQGQILVPEDLEATIYSELPNINTIIGEVTTLPTIRDRVRRRSLSHVTVGWGKLELGTPSNADSFVSTSTPDDDFIYIEDLYGLTELGEDEVEDSDVALEAFMITSFGFAMEEAQDDKIMDGLGHASLQMEGLLKGTTLERIVASTPGAVDFEDMIDLQDSMDERYAAAGTFYVHRSTRTSFRKMKGLDGQYMWQESVRVGEPSTFLGAPIRAHKRVAAIPAAGTAADVAVWVNARVAYQRRLRRGMTVRRLDDSAYSKRGLIGLLTKMRVGGGVVRAAAGKVLRVPAS